MLVLSSRPARMVSDGSEDLALSCTKHSFIVCRHPRWLYDRSVRPASQDLLLKASSGGVGR